jgi:DNA-binding NtrC family response regulator
MAQRSKLRVLVIDDDEGICQFLKDSLTADGYQVSAVTRPDEALQEVREGRYQVVLLDLRMPELDGASLLREIRSHDSDLCVIVMTAYPSVETAVETMKAQAFDYIRKPFELDELRRTLEKAVRESGLVVDPEERLNQAIGAKIRALRTENSLTLKQVANKTGLSVSLISQIELGKSAASVSTLQKLAAALKVKMAYLFEGL